MDKYPELKTNFDKVVEKYKAGSPMEEIIWIDVPVTSLAKEISELGIECSTYICKQLLKVSNLEIRKMSKSLTLKNVEYRNEQFENIYKLVNEYIESDNPIISVDVKKKEMIGNFYRDGKCYCNEALKVNDHDFNTFSSGTIVPHGVYDLKNNLGYITLSESKDTCEFNCDSIKNWWINYGKQIYPNANSILVLCDGGGSNTSRGYLFKESIQKLSNELSLEIRIAHFPPYTSKHNPIEHKLFSYISKNLKGFLISSIEAMANRIKTTTTKKGLKVVVNISKKIYEIGKKVSDNFKENCSIIFDDYLGKWNYVAIPQNREVII